MNPLQMNHWNLITDFLIWWIFFDHVLNAKKISYLQYNVSFKNKK